MPNSLAYFVHALHVVAHNEGNKMKALKIAANKAGKRYAIVRKDDCTFTVYAECSNYAAHVRGGIEKTWRYVEKSLTLEAAEALFIRKIAGMAR
jgi:hypothetical protein